MSQGDKIIHPNNLKALREELGITRREFAKRLDVNEANYSNMESGKRVIGAVMKLRLQKLFPLIDTDWLAHAKGDKYEKSIAHNKLISYKDDYLMDALARQNDFVEANANELGVISYPIERSANDNTTFIPIGGGQFVMLCPLVNEYAYAGYLAGYKDPEYIMELPRHSIIVNKEHKGVYKAFEVLGDSMENDERPRESIYDGSIVTGHMIQQHLWRGRLHTHRWSNWVFVHKEGILIKRIKDHKVEDGIVILESLNPDKSKFPDKEMRLDDMQQIFAVVNISIPQ